MSGPFRRTLTGAERTHLRPDAGRVFEAARFARFPLAGAETGSAAPTPLAACRRDCYRERVFGFGFTEMAVIVLVAVMLFPPRELPKIARGIAKLYGQIRKTADDFRASVLEDEDLNAPIREIRSVYNEARYEVKRGRDLTQREIAKARMEARMAAKKVKDSVDPRHLGKTKRKPVAPDAAANEAALSESTPSAPTSSAPAAEPGDSPAEPGDSPAPAERPAREVLVSATAGSNRPEDAPPERRKPRSKLSVPADLQARVGAPVEGRVARPEREGHGDGDPSGGTDDAGETGEADKGVA